MKIRNILVGFSDWWFFNYKLADACSQISCLLYNVASKVKVLSKPENSLLCRICSEVTLLHECQTLCDLGRGVYNTCKINTKSHAF